MAKANEYRHSVNENVYSVFKRGELYLRYGEKVKIVADHDNVLIVERKDGKRYPVLKSKINIQSD